MPKTLYICYFGLREPLVQTQVIPYLLEIMTGGTDVSLLTFEPDLKSAWTAEGVDAERQVLKGKGITWHHLAYHKRPSVPATLYDILNGARLIKMLNGRENFDVLHCRVHVPALMAVIARRFSRSKPKILFDIRGFFPEEYTDAGIWPENGLLYRVVKRVEKWLLNEADGFVVLTEKARAILFPESLNTGFDKRGRPVEVIPCCVDLTRFAGLDLPLRNAVRSEFGVEDRYVIVYVGSFGGWYLTDEIFAFFAAARAADPRVFVMILTQRQAEKAAEGLRAKGFGDSDFFVGSVPPNELPRYLSAADGSISFIKKCYSKQASSPTKNAEYLAAGLPIVANSGVGDVDRDIGEDDVGVLIDDFDGDTLAAAVNRLRGLTDIRDRCRDSARKRFDLKSVGGVRYRQLYARLFCKQGN